MTRQLGFQNGVRLLCSAGRCGRDHCGERDRQGWAAGGKSLSGLREADRPEAAATPCEKKWVGGSGKQLHRRSPAKPANFCHTSGGRKPTTKKEISPEMEIGFLLKLCVSITVLHKTKRMFLKFWESTIGISPLNFVAHISLNSS